MGRSIRPFGAGRCAIVLTALFCLAGERQAAAGGTVRFEFPMETYTQKVEIVFRSEAAAGRASVEVLPLYDGSEWALTGRWDDNTHQANLNMRDLFVRHGYKPTFYLTQGRGIGAKELKELLRGGGSLAGHSLTHPWLPRQSSNRMFEELAGIRIHLEAASDSPVCSYGFSFLAFGSSIYGPAWHADVTRALERAGYYHLAERNYHNKQRTDMLLSPFLPSDGSDIEGEVQKRLSGRSWLKQPNLTFTMHAPAFEKPPNRAKLDGWLTKYGRRPEWWYCNQNEYAAYRYQFRYSKLTRPVARGKILTFSLRRPAVRDLNDRVPLSFEVGGVPRAAVLEARSPDANCEPGGRPGNSYVFHLHHDRGRLLPAKIGVTYNRGNAPAPSARAVDPDFPKLVAHLHAAEGALRLTLQNRGAKALSDLRVTYRLPLAYKEGVVRRRCESVAPGRRYEDTLSYTQVTEDYIYTSGSSFFVAQIDFVRGREPGRIHATCNVDNTDADPSFPQGGFSRLGPIPVDELTDRKLTSFLKGGRGAARTWLLGDGKRLAPTVAEGALAAPWLGPEMILTTRRWYSRFPPAYYILKSTVHSPGQASVKLRYLKESIEKVFLNGAEVGERAVLRRGPNDLVLVYRSPGPGVKPEKPGCFFRISDPQTGRRLANVRYKAE